jgi:hypothetical protein
VIGLIRRRDWPEHLAVAPHFATWVFSDVHGVASGLRAGLRQAGLTDGAGDWDAPSETQLIGLGDYIDRGADSIGVLELLWRLEQQAPASGGRVVLLRGDHEQLLMGAILGDAAAWQVWLSDFAGGATFLRSIDADPERVAAGGPRELRSVLGAAVPDIYQRLEAMPEWCIWGDAFLAHAGLPPFADPDSLEPGGEHLWQDAEYDAASDERWNLDGPAFGAARRLGISRIVYGHVTQPGYPKLDQDGRALCLDTNAAAVELVDRPLDRGAALTLVRLAPKRTLAASEFVRVDTRDAADRAAASL